MSGRWTGTRAVEPTEWDSELMDAVALHFGDDSGGTMITIHDPMDGRDRVVVVVSVVGWARTPYTASRVMLLLAHVSEEVDRTRHMLFPAHDIRRIEKARAE